MSMCRPFYGVTNAYTDADSVAAVNAWRQRQPQVVQGVPLVLVSGAAAVTYIQMTTTVLAAGEYRVDAVGFFSGTNSGTDFRMDLGIDGVPVPGIFGEFVVGATTSRLIFSGTASFQFSAGVHTLEGFVSQPSSPGSATSELAILQLERVA